MTDELLNVYDAAGRIVGTQPRTAAKASGRAVGAVNLLVVHPHGRVLLQRRPEDKENGGLWDKSVGGHVAAGETFDATVVREAGEELFDAAESPRVRLLPDREALRAALAAGEARGAVLLYRAGLQLSLRDVRHAPGRAGHLNVLYHVGIYLGASELPLAALAPPAEEIAELGWFTPGEVDGLLLQGRLAPNMAFLWLAHGQALLDLVR
jgi:hypothetical protein